MSYEIQAKVRVAMALLRRVSRNIISEFSCFGLQFPKSAQIATAGFAFDKCSSSEHLAQIAA